MVNLAVFKRKHKSHHSDVEVTFASHSKGSRDNLPTGNSKSPVVSTTCCCCGAALKHPQIEHKLKCMRCHCTLELTSNVEVRTSHISVCRFQQFEDVVVGCKMELEQKGKTLGSDFAKCHLHEIFRPLEIFLERLFSSVSSLNHFCTASNSELGQYDYKNMSSFYATILSLPTKKPFYKLLICSNERLKKPRANFYNDSSVSNFDQLLWVLMILENPLLRQSLKYNENCKPLAPHIRAIQYEVLKRSIGYLASVNEATGKDVIKYLQGLSSRRFDVLVDLLNLYITFHFSRILRKRAKMEACFGSPDLDEFCSDSKLNPRKLDNDFEILPRMVGKFLTSNGRPDLDLPVNFKFNVTEYGNDWHIRTAARLQYFHFVASQRKHKCATSRFYNMLSDYLDYKKDYEQWKIKLKGNAPESLKSFVETLDGLTFSPGKNPETQFTMCQFPFLMTMGVKISIMEYEIRKAMEHNAEQAFLKALDKKKVVDVYLRICIRRDHVAEDSLRCIEAHRSDLGKSLRVEFINEPGIDAGGLRKEWFSLLTKEIFNPDNGLFIVIDESRFSWFNMAYDGLGGSPQNSSKLYYLFGIVLGLAIYNGTILDVCFPRALYKKLCGEPLGSGDYLELYPETGRNIMKMVEYKEKDFEDIFCLNFEVNYPDAWGHKIHRRELCSDGAKRQVTRDNCSEYARLWMDFHLNKAIGNSFEVFMRGFQRVVRGDAFRLFNSKEVELLLCGSRDKDIDVSTLKSVSKYGNGFTSQSTVVKWFWEIFDELNTEEKRKLLEFVTGSDRIPATGISTIPFKVSRLGDDCDRLPIAHTCFNELCIYEYGDGAKLKKKLMVAIYESEGYGFR
ncbi:LAME_0E12288g1_1 [Lachancea meyersii CBS 8951]|uniref:HECT-type E3 ubiquitin transferase n=1 Tax=Lachancea meyersii CBS 8951 TaxID=1266667 RepID=A0A1G4JLJ9_9SACH|nr:LAME_0E12288g1_1 [Lachancea meyersii CBS 8951]